MRVLEEARNPRHPLLERLRFLSISGNNLDEFFMVRVAGLVGQIKAKLAEPSDDGLSPAEQLDKVRKFAQELMAEQDTRWLHLREELAANGIAIVGRRRNSATATELARRSVSRSHPAGGDTHCHRLPIPSVHPERGFIIALELKRRKDASTMRALLPIPQQLDRFIRLPTQQSGPHRALHLARKHVDVFLPRLFPGYDVLGQGLFRIIRDSDIEIEERSRGPRAAVRKRLKRRRRGTVIAWRSTLPAPRRCANSWPMNRCPRRRCGDLRRPHWLCRHQAAHSRRAPDLKFKPFVARFPERIRDHGGDCFAAIRQKDIHRPSSLRILRRRRPVPPPGGEGPDVVAIKQSSTALRTTVDRRRIGESSRGRQGR